MPIYEYCCQICGKQYEKLVRSGETPPCPACHSTEVRKLLSGFAFRSKGADGTTTAFGSDNCDSCHRTTCTGCH